MRYLRACLDPRVLLGLAAVGVAVVVLAPGLVAAALPMLVVAACPISMVLMMRAMGQSGQARPSVEPGADRLSDVRRELVDLAARQRGLEAELASLERPDRRPASVGARER